MYHVFIGFYFFFSYQFYGVYFSELIAIIHVAHVVGTLYQQLPFLSADFKLSDCRACEQIISLCMVLI